MITGKTNLNQKLSQAAFKNLVPHSGLMLLIDRVESWTQKQITTCSCSHQNLDNPLRLAGTLSSLHLIEYGAQTMAIHCGLLTGKAQTGFLAAVKNARFYIDNLDTVNGELVINAKAELQLSKGAVYQFTVSDSSSKLLLTAQATVIHL
jgi:predicted hotdog family 3-hydroxylacyl-ACP dehydratase